jgi:hypothetical protein
MKPAKIIFFVAAFSLLFVVGGVRAQQIPGPVELGTYCALNELSGCAQDTNGNFYYVKCIPRGNDLLFYTTYSYALNELIWQKYSAAENRYMWYSDWGLHKLAPGVKYRDYVFDSFEECANFCIDKGGHYGPMVACVHDESFKMPSYSSAITPIGWLNSHGNPIAACVADDGIYSCSQSGQFHDYSFSGAATSIYRSAADINDNPCGDAAGCYKKECFNAAPATCGRLAYTGKYKDQASIVDVPKSTTTIAENTNPEETQVAENNAAGEQLTAENSAGLQNSVLAGEPPVAPLAPESQYAQTQNANNNCDWLCGLGEWFGSIF